MCTAISLKTKDHYFGRNFDLDISYGENVVITPRNFPFNFRKVPPSNRHYALIGIATLREGYPLYYDATNEKGLSIAGLNFPESAQYMPISAEKDNVAPFELIPYVLSKCATISEVKALLENMNLAEIHFSSDLPLSPLHWIIADRESSIVVESVSTGLKVYDNPTGVLTNDPPFDMQMMSLRNYMNLSNQPPENRFSQKLNLKPYSYGMGAMGLPGDFSSNSRFIKAVFTSSNSLCGNSEAESVSQFFHLLRSVEMPMGSINLGENRYETTRYSSCCNTSKGIYYYTTYSNSTVNAVDMHKEQLDCDKPIIYPLAEELFINYQN